ncbi:XrtA/PEP-CTERM system histidine kinase PrsK [Teredinibacter franksiae]|uniref:XrtA/PEP-CTERM system histidine kinase PrsK n=1 Tax=Teredinibacter franksiae TaxID=2761453 RepID=UPI001628C4DA|nr:XrtA/PEP-CTERM system histidine kinase PrsK [Teredinibacter franksiae]
MEFSNVTQTAFASAALLFFVLSATLIAQHKNTRLHWSFPLAAVGHLIWLSSIPLVNQLHGLDSSYIYIAETLHYSLWLFALVRNTEVFCSNALPKIFKYPVYIAAASALVISTYLTTLSSRLISVEHFIIWQGILFSIAGLLGVEQLYRNVINYRLVKLLSLSLAIIFIFDAYLFSQSLVFLQLNSDLWQARAAVSMATSIFMTIGVVALNMTSMQSAKITFSRPVAFYTTSLTIAGISLTLLAAGGYYVELYGGTWGTVIYTLLLACGLISVGAVFSSRTAREKMKVLINKHLFSHKYDYRAEWLKLINQLSQPTEPDEIHARAIAVVAELFKSNGGALWVKRGKVLVPVQQVHVSIDVSEMIEPNSSEFCAELTQEWVFSPSSPSAALAQHNNLLPEWVEMIDEVWMIMPLLNESSLVGFIALTAPQANTTLNWEDLDLVKTVGRQVASYLERHEQSELLAESRQFDAFNKLSAYVMHDLKNLIAQQSLVVKNAEKHKDNPAFVEDAINTINNSVNRMNNLLRKLQHNEPEEISILAMKQVLIDAVKRCQKSTPPPTLRTIDPEWKVKADQDSLIMVFTHIIQNAQDATAEEGFIDISTEQDGNIACIYIEDNGLGMDTEFIQSRLFKPFETTKTGKGMGIGMYQAREYAQSLGGNIAVESSPGEGTTFIITLPLL